MDITNFIRDGVTYPIGDAKSRESIATAFDSTASYSAGDYAMYDGTLYKFTSSHSGDWNPSHAEATCVTDELGSGGGGNAQVMYYYQQPVNTATNAEIFRITSGKINTDTVVLECTFADPSYITSDVTWTSYEGYIAFTGTCTTATTANVTMAYKSDDIITTTGLDLLYEGNPTANTDTSLITGKKFSDYKSLFVEADGGSINRFATAMSVTAFSASSSANWWFGDPRMSGTSYYCLIRYTSDTQFQIREKGSALTYFKIYGDGKYSTISPNIPDSGDIPVTLQNCTGDIIVRKIGNVCSLFVNVNPSAQIAASADLVLGILPEGYRPLHRLTIPCGSRNRWGSLNIGDDSGSGDTPGVLHYFNVSSVVATSSGLYAQTTYMVE